MVKVINISNKTIKVAGVELKPHTGHLYVEMSTSDRLKVAALACTNIVRAYEEKAPTKKTKVDNKGVATRSRTTKNKNSKN